MYFGVKKYQKHFCYFNEETAAALTRDNGEMIPNQVEPPNFDLALSSTYPCEEGLFRCRVTAFYG